MASRVLTRRRQDVRRARRPARGSRAHVARWPAAASLLLTAAIALVAVACRETARPEATGLAGPGLRLAYDERGDLRPESRGARDQVFAAAAEATDVVVFSHGWWNSEATAECRYRQVIDGLRGRKPPALAGDFRPVLVGIYWPSAVFPVAPGDCESDASLLEGGTSPVAGEAARARLETWARAAFPAATARPAFGAEVARLAELLEKERGSAPLTREEGETVVAILFAWRDAGRRPEEAHPRDVPGEPSFTGAPATVAARWQPSGPPGAGGGTSEAGGRSAAAPSRFVDWANVFTVWTMKERAGIVGSRGVYELLGGLQAGRARGLRIHLVGHSFGGKLLSAAITGHGRGPGHVVDSFVIVQGAFSHFAFSTAEEIRALGVTTERGGLYAGVADVRGVTGPLVVTYSGFDTPNAVFYPMAFGLVRDMLEADEVPRYGALGANGIKGPRVRSLNLATERLADRPGPDAPRLVSVNASAVIQGHADFVKAQVFDLIWDAIVAGRLPPR
jgi:hypothetical protein